METNIAYCISNMIAYHKIEKANQSSLVKLV